MKDFETTPATLNLTAQDAFTRSIFDGVARGEFTAHLQCAWRDEERDGEFGVMLKITPTVPVQAVRPDTDTVIEAAIDKVAQAFPPEDPPTPEENALADLLADPATRDVAEHLLKPLVRRLPPLVFEPGKERETLSRTALRFKRYPKHKLKFAVDHLLKGKHVQWPDKEEFYAAFGRYGGNESDAEDTVVIDERAMNGRAAA